MEGHRDSVHLNVARQFNVSQYVVSRLRNRHQQTENVTDLPRSGRPRSTTRDTLNCLAIVTRITAIMQHPCGPPSLVLG